MRIGYPNNYAGHIGWGIQTFELSIVAPIYILMGQIKLINLLTKSRTTIPISTQRYDARGK